MSLYLKLDQDTVNQYDYGYSITGRVFENKSMTTPHSLEQYDRVEFRTFRPSQDYVNVREDVTVDDTNRFTLIVQRGFFIYDGIFHCVLGMISQGINRSTKYRQFHVKSNGTLGDGVVIDNV